MKFYCSLAENVCGKNRNKLVESRGSASPSHCKATRKQATFQVSLKCRQNTSTTLSPARKPNFGQHVLGRDPLVLRVGEELLQRAARGEHKAKERRRRAQWAREKLGVELDRHKVRVVCPAARPERRASSQWAHE